MGRIFAFIFFILVWLPSFVFAQPYIEGEKPVINGRTGIQIVNTGTGEIRLVTSADSTAKGFYLDSSTGNLTGVGGSGVGSLAANVTALGDILISNSGFIRSSGTAARYIGSDSTNRTMLISADTNGAAAANLILLTDATQGGGAELASGVAANAGVTINAKGASGTLVLKTVNLNRWVVGSTGNLTQDATNGGHLYFARAGYGVRTNGLDLTIGTETAHAIGLSTNGSTKWTFDSGGTLTSNATNGGDLILSKSGSTISVQEATPTTACIGVATPNGTTPITVTTSCAVTGSRVIFSRVGSVTNQGSISITSNPSGAGFNLASSNAADTLASSVVWFIIKESA